MSVEQYVEYVTLNYMGSSEFDDLACDRWIVEENFRYLLNKSIDNALSQYGYVADGRYANLLDEHIAVLLNTGVIKSEGDDFNGLYCKCDVTGKDNYIRSVLQRHPVSVRIKSLGEPALRRALSVAAAKEGWTHLESDVDAETDIAIENPTYQLNQQAPASNRIVTFSDNQSEELDVQTTEVIRAVESQNQLDGTPGLRELLIGQLKAGREFIRAGSFKLYFLQITLIDTLAFLAQRYEKEAIGGLAAALITALIKHIGIDA